MFGDMSRQLGMVVGWQVLQEGTWCHKAGACCVAHQTEFQVQGVALCIPTLAFGGGTDAAHGCVHRESCRESTGRSTITLTLSVPLPGAEIAAKAFPLKASLVARWEGTPAAPISHGRGRPRTGRPCSAWPPCKDSPCCWISSSPSSCTGYYSKSLSAGVVRVTKIKLDPRGDPLSSPLTSPGAGAAMLLGSRWALSTAGKSSSK